VKLHTLILISVLGIISINTAYAEKRLSERSVSNMLKTMEKSAKSHDAETLMSFFSKNAKIILDMPAKLGGKTVMGVSKFTDMLKQSWGMKAEFTYETRDVVISIAADGKSAIATDLTLETVSIGGKLIMSTKTKEKITIELIDGKPLIMELYGKVEI